MSFACEKHHMSVAEGPGLEKNNSKVNIKTIASFPSLLKRFREGNSLYSRIVTVMQLKTIKIDIKIKIHFMTAYGAFQNLTKCCVFQKWKEDVGCSDVKTTWL